MVGAAGDGAVQACSSQHSMAQRHVRSLKSVADGAADDADLHATLCGIAQHSMAQGHVRSLYRVVDGDGDDANLHAALREQRV